MFFSLFNTRFSFLLRSLSLNTVTSWIWFSSLSHSSGKTLCRCNKQPHELLMKSLMNFTDVLTYYNLNAVHFYESSWSVLGCDMALGSNSPLEDLL